MVRNVPQGGSSPSQKAVPELVQRLVKISCGTGGGLGGWDAVREFTSTHHPLKTHGETSSHRTDP